MNWITPLAAPSPLSLCVSVVFRLQVPLFVLKRIINAITDGIYRNKVQSKHKKLTSVHSEMSGLCLLTTFSNHKLGPSLLDRCALVVFFFIIILLFLIPRLNNRTVT